MEIVLNFKILFACFNRNPQRRSTASRVGYPNSRARHNIHVITPTARQTTTVVIMEAAAPAPNLKGLYERRYEAKPYFVSHVKICSSGSQNFIQAHFPMHKEQGSPGFLDEHKEH